MFRVAGLLLLTACASAPVRLYEGPPRAREEVVRVDPGDFLVYAVDDTELDERTRVDRKTLELLPGTHVIRAIWSRDFATSDKLRIQPRGRGFHQGTGTRSGVLAKYRKYFHEITIDAEAGSAWEGIWVEVPGERGAPPVRRPDLRRVEER